MANESMTIQQALSITVELLKGIMVPAEYAESIGLPISRSIGNLKECINAIDSQIEAMMKEQKEESRKETDDERETDAE